MLHSFDVTLTLIPANFLAPSAENSSDRVQYSKQYGTPCIVLEKLDRHMIIIDTALEEHFHRSTAESKSNVHVIHKVHVVLQRGWLAQK